MLEIASVGTQFGGIHRIGSVYSFCQCNGFGAPTQWYLAFPYFISCCALSPLLLSSGAPQGTDQNSEQLVLFVFGETALKPTLPRSSGIAGVTTSATISFRKSGAKGGR